VSQRIPNKGGSVGAIPPRWFWAASAIGLLWNLAGVAAFVAQMTMDASSLPAAERAFYEATPVWATAAFSIAVAAGVIGSAALLFRRRWAVSVFAASLLAIVVQISHSLFIGDGIDVFGPAGFILPLLTFGIGVALVGLSNHSAARGWLK